MRAKHDYHGLLFTLNEGIHGNMGGMGNAALYHRAAFGTKQLIEDYVDEIVDALELLGQPRYAGDHHGGKAGVLPPCPALFWTIRADDEWRGYAALFPRGRGKGLVGAGPATEHHVRLQRRCFRRQRTCHAQ